MQTVYHMKYLNDSQVLQLERDDSIVSIKYQNSFVYLKFTMV